MGEHTEATSRIQPAGQHEWSEGNQLIDGSDQGGNIPKQGIHLTRFISEVSRRRRDDLIGGLLHSTLSPRVHGEVKLLVVLWRVGPRRRSTRNQRGMPVRPRRRRSLRGH
jgi:hypothetical protein